MMLRKKDATGQPVFTQTQIDTATGGDFSTKISPTFGGLVPGGVGHSRAPVNMPELQRNTTPPLAPVK